MKEVKVISAKTMAKKHKAVGCIVLCFDQNSAMVGASYGTNRHNCEEMCDVMNFIFDLYYQGDMGKPIFVEGRRSKFPA